MPTRVQKKEIAEGQAIITKAGLPSMKLIDAHNYWRCVVLLRGQLGKRSMRIHEVRPEHIVEWLS
jgi:hypothetical protein